MSEKLQHLTRFYSAIDRLEEKVGGRRILRECNGRMNWPERGVYFFMENSEARSDSGKGLRITRVGTHALTVSSRTTLWKRLSQHKGTGKSGGGNHRGSIFRKLVGTSLYTSHPTWGQGQTADRETRNSELSVEQEVSRVIGEMPFIWLPIDDPAGAESLRGMIERNSIALLSNSTGIKLDPPSSKWIGHACAGERVRSSGLWNQNHVDESYSPLFLEKLDELVSNVR